MKKYTIKEKPDDKKVSIYKAALLLSVMFFVVGVYFTALGFYSEKHYFVTGGFLLVIFLICLYFVNYYKLTAELEYSDGTVTLYKNSGSRKKIIKALPSSDIVLVKKENLIYNKKVGSENPSGDKIVVSKNRIIYTEDGGENFAIIKTDKKVFAFNLDSYFEFLLKSNEG